MPASAPVTTARRSAPIGVFDSGVGGLSVLRAIRQTLPGESLIYCADSRYAPYGDRAAAFITDRALAIGGWLVSEGAKAIVVACNTATTNAIAALRATLPVPIIGIEPGIKPAVAQSKTRVVGVLATAATLKTDKFQTLLAAHSADCRLVCVAGIGLVEAVERGDTDSAALRSLLTDYLAPILAAGADTLALGCTHYPFLASLIETISDGRLQIVDNGAPVARQLARQLDAHGLLCERDVADAPLRLVSTGRPAHLALLTRFALRDAPTCRGETRTIESPSAPAEIAVSG